MVDPFTPAATIGVASLGAKMALSGGDTSQGSPLPAEQPAIAAWQPLQPGDMVAFVAPSYATHKEQYSALADTVRSWGLQAVQQPDITQEPGYYIWPNTPERRAEHIITALKDPNIKAIIAVEGGEGASEVVEALKKREAELNALPRRAIPLIGYSDSTQLQLFLGQKGLVSPVQGPSIEFLTPQPGMEGAQQSMVYSNQKALQDFLMGAQAVQPAVTLLPINQAAKETSRISGILTGGGDISIGLANDASHRLKTESYKGQILFLEGRSSASLRYALEKLQDRKQLGNVDAIVLGRYYDNQQYAGDLSQAYVNEVQKTLQEMGVTKPVYFGVPAGHTSGEHAAAPVIPLPLHTQAEIVSGAQGATLAFARFRDISECDYCRALPQDVPAPVTPLAADAAPVSLVQVPLNELRLPDTSAALQKDFTGKRVVLDFGEHASISVMHTALMSLQGAGRLSGAKSVLLASSQPVTPEAQAWLKDFQQRNLPAVPMELAAMQNTALLTSLSAGAPQQGPVPR